jgi:hypothetical protein
VRFDAKQERHEQTGPRKRDAQAEREAEQR